MDPLLCSWDSSNINEYKTYLLFSAKCFGCMKCMMFSGKVCGVFSGMILISKPRTVLRHAQSDAHCLTYSN